MRSAKKAVIIGAGPAGLTAAYELLTRANIEPIVLEKSDMTGGLSRTVVYKGNRIDIGGHRFFSKSDRVMKWWAAMMPLQKGAASSAIQYHGMQTRVQVNGTAKTANPEESDVVMLLRERKSRIYFLRSFFEYPIRLSRDTLAKLGLVRTIRIGLSYLKSAILPRRQENTLEDFLINRFGKELYRTFFES